MQDRYAGDIGDYGKYGLLRWLCRADGRGAPFLRPKTNIWPGPTIGDRSLFVLPSREVGE